MLEWQSGRELLRRLEVVAMPPAPFLLRTLNHVSHSVTIHQFKKIILFARHGFCGMVPFRRLFAPKNRARDGT